MTRAPIQRLLRLEETARSRFADASFALSCANHTLRTTTPGTPRDRDARRLALRAADSVLHWNARLTRIEHALRQSVTPTESA